ncbi:Rieske 2Fe-2S domain-containing protein [Rhizobium sp. LjRoot30]|uniref:Rieske 2Fe-2S domain-containing protein n=1 Tax=Rhizobium sp. LjRoot30 TaxID=3342320 RepID=UPI003ECCB881
MLQTLRQPWNELPPLSGPKREAAERAMRRQWWAVARSTDLDTPQPAVLLGERLVVYRTASGKPVVQSRRCPHRGGDFSQGKVHGEGIACPYHGWQFGSDGKCAHIPSLDNQSKIPGRATIATYPVIEKWGHVWTVLEQPAMPMYELDAWAGLDLEWLAGPPLDSETGVAVAIENFRDVAHFPFVHEVSMGPSPHIVEPLMVKREGLDIWMQRSLNAGNGDWANDGDCEMYYHCTAPGLATITYDYAKYGKRIVAGFPSPMAYDHVMIFWGVANERSYSGADIEECLRIEEMVYREDLPIAGALEPREVDWDGTYVEHSVPADLFTLNYRRAFNEFVGTALVEQAG